MHSHQVQQTAVQTNPLSSLLSQLNYLDKMCSALCDADHKICGVPCRLRVRWPFLVIVG